MPKRPRNACPYCNSVNITKRSGMYKCIVCKRRFPKPETKEVSIDYKIPPLMQSILEKKKEAMEMKNQQ